MWKGNPIFSFEIPLIEPDEANPYEFASEYRVILAFDGDPLSLFIF